MKASKAEVRHEENVERMVASMRGKSGQHLPSRRNWVMHG